MKEPFLSENMVMVTWALKLEDFAKSVNDEVAKELGDII